jgi:hypothetical protein
MNSKNQRGGVRKGAGRKKDSGLYAESTKVVRIPISRISEVKIGKVIYKLSRTAVCGHFRLISVL